MCFTGLCDNNAIYLICNEYAKNGWDSVPDSEYGNYDYLMGNDIEFRNPAVREELQHWGRWYTAETGIDGFRLDALKHMSATFARSWIDEMRKHFSKDFYTIGEYWKNDLNELQRYLHETDHALRLFDVPLHFNFHEASQKRSEYDLRQIFDNTLVKAKPDFAITFVENHDTQPLQSLQSPVEEWFKPAAYAMILLRQQGTPCVFYADLLGAQYRATTNEGKEAFVELKKVNGLEAMMQLRRAGINGSQHDYFERSDLIGWCVYDDEQKKESAFAVVIGNRDDTELKMSFGGLYAKQHFREVCGSFTNSIALDENGEANFPVKAGSVSIWVLTIV
jgi:alpha-amylase